MATVVTIRVETLAGNGCEVKLVENATVRQAKHEIQALLNVHVCEQRLVVGGTVLDDDLKPFAEIVAKGAPIQIVRVLFANLKSFAAEEGLKLENPSELTSVFCKAAAADKPNVCFEALSHEHWPSHNTPGFDVRGNLSCVAQGGFAHVFEALVEHPEFGQQEGVLDAAYMTLHLAATRGLPLHCKSMIESPHFTAAAKRKELNWSTVLHHAANESILRLLFTCEALVADECINARDVKGCTCLHYASTEGACRAVLEQPSFTAANTADAYGDTALHGARAPGVCAAIIAHPGFTAVNHYDKKGSPALHKLVRTDAALPLLEARAVARAAPDDDAAGAAQHPHAAVHLELEALDGRGRTALFYAHSAEVCRALFRAGFAAVNVKDLAGRSALACCPDAGVAGEILAHPGFMADNACGLDLHEATRLQRHDVATLLMEAGIEPLLEEPMTAWKACKLSSPLAVLSMPAFYGGSTVNVILSEQLLSVVEERVGEDGVLYLRLHDGNGWVPEKSRSGKVICQRCKEPPFEQRKEALCALMRGVSATVARCALM